MNMGGRIGRGRGIIIILVVQLALVVALNLLCPDTWPKDDDLTYLFQGFLIRMGAHPPAPTRPVLYPFLLGLAMHLTGLSTFRLGLAQGVMLAATTALVYRLGQRLAGARTGLIAAGLFAAFPDGLFYSARFYREPLGALLLMVSLNLVQAMLARPRRVAPAFFAGVAAGLMVLNKAESGLLFAGLALLGLGYAIKEREFRAHALPWIVCGVTALATTVPAVLAARAAFGEWIFVSTYTGNTYVWAYCGSLDDPSQDNERMSFREKDAARAARVSPLSNRVLYFSDPSIPWKARDRFLRRRAGECVRERTGQAASMVWNRGLMSLFLLDGAATDWIRGGQFGRPWPAAVTQLLLAADWMNDAAVLLLLAPGLWILLKDRPGRPAGMAVLWHLGFYSSVYYVSRYRITAWPVFALAAAAGLGAVEQALRRRSRRAGAAIMIWVMACGLGIGYVSRPWQSGLWQWARWTHMDFGEGLSEAKRAAFLAMMAEGVEQFGTTRILDGELGPYVRARSGSLDSRILSAAADQAGKKKLITSQLFFYRMSSELYPGDGESEVKVKALEALRREVEPGPWKLAGTIPERGVAVYTAGLGRPAIMSEYGPPLDTRLNGSGGPFGLNRNLQQGLDPAPGQYYIKDAQIWITLPAASPAPAQPLRLDYYALP